MKCIKCKIMLGLVAASLITAILVPETAQAVGINFLDNTRYLAIAFDSSMLVDYPPSEFAAFNSTISHSDSEPGYYSANASQNSSISEWQISAVGRAHLTAGTDADFITRSYFELVFEVTIPQIYDLSGSVGGDHHRFGGASPEDAGSGNSLSLVKDTSDTIFSFSVAHLTIPIDDEYPDLTNGILDVGLYTLTAESFAFSDFSTFGYYDSFDSGGSYSFTLDLTPVPEPATMLLLGTGLIGIVVFRKRFSKK